MKGRLFKVSLWIIISLIVLASAVFGFIYFNQTSIVQHQLNTVNHSYQGKISVGESHVALFESFPYISLKVDDVKVYEFKHENAPLIVDVADIYVGFNIWDILAGNYDIQSIIVEEGLLDIVLHENGSTNIENALLSPSEDTAQSDPINIHLKTIEFRTIELHQREEATKLDIATSIEFAKGGFQLDGENIRAHIDTKFVLDILNDGQATYFNDKHVEFHTDIDYNQTTGLLSFEPSGIVIEHGDFELEGSIDTKNEMTVDIDIKGTKPSFDMFIAFAPTEIIPVLERYENAGKIYFNAKIEGPTTNGKSPFIEANFGASEAFLENIVAKKRIDQMGFSGHFSNGTNRDLTTMEFSMNNISASLEKGKIIGDISVVNFEEPDIEMTVDANFNLDFWVDFLQLEDVDDIKGRVEMHMKFHDIIDIDHPEKALKDLNQAYYAEMEIEDFSLSSSSLPAPLNDLDVHIEMKGKKADLDKFQMSLGNSDVSISGFLSDLPAIVHHASIPVEAHLDVSSSMLDFAEITKYSERDSTGFNERIKDLSMSFSFNALANAFTEFKHLPKGEFFIDNLYADLQNYPHQLHDFHADVLIKEDDLKIIDFTGNIDTTDFHFNGIIQDYSFWMQDQLNGEVDLNITLTSDLFRLEDLFTYNGVNFVPPDYRHEEIENLELHVMTAVVYDSSHLKAVDIQLDKWAGKMHMHPLKFEDFSGNFHIENEHLMISDFKGKMGQTKFDIDLNYYLGKIDSIKKRDNHLSLRSNYINFDELFNFQVKPTETAAKDSIIKTTEDVAEHADAFNIFEIPFTDMTFDVEVDHFIYHRYDLQQVNLEMRTTKKHQLVIDTIDLNAAGGNIVMKGVLDGKDPKHIFMRPKMRLTNVDLDQLLFKFENFGQDELVSDNLHGKLNASIWGDIRVYPDLIPDLDQSEVHVHAQVLNGRLDNYEPILLLSEYFGDKDLTSIRFDTITNYIDMTNGTLTIPSMTIESTLGHLELSGTHDLEDNIDYFVRVPMSLIKEAGKNKLFGAKRDKDAKEDEIVEVDPNKNIRYLNINMVGTIDDFDIKMRKPKKRKK